MLIRDKKAKEYRKKIAQSSERIQNILEATNAGTWEWNCSTGELWFSEKCAEIFGYSYGEIAPMAIDGWRSFVHPEDLHILREGFIQMIRRKEDSYEIEFRANHKDGHCKWVSNFGKVLKWNDDSRPSLVIGTIIDISKRVQLEQKNRESEKRYKTIITVSKTGAWEYNIETEEQWSSREYFEMLGYDADENNAEKWLKRNVWEDLLHPGDLESAYKISSEYMMDPSDKIYENTFRMKNAKGEYNWILARGEVLKDHLGNPTSIVVGTHIDITEIKLKEKELEFASYHDYLTGVFNRRYLSKYINEIDDPKNYPIGLMMMDINGLKLYNDAFGITAGDKVLKKVSEEIDRMCFDFGILARVGGDEFAVVTANKDREFLEDLKIDIQNRVSQLEFGNVKLSLSIDFYIKDDKETTIEKLLEQAETNMYKRKILDSRSTRNSTIRGILQTLTDKYEVERKHSERVSKYCREMGIELGIEGDDLKELEISGMLHDIGKISIPDNILDKPGRLTREEFEIIKSHTERGYNILRAADDFSDIAIYALSHHERFDGDGYPNGIKALEIPLYSRIISIADAYEAMTSNRPYRSAMTKDAAVKELVKYSGTQFDPELVEIFIKKIAGRA